MAVRPAAGRRAIEVLLESELPHAEGQRLVLVDATFEGGDRETGFTVRINGRKRHVRITEQNSPLGIVDAWQRHRSQEDPDGDSVLVVTGAVPADQLGWDLRAHAVRRRSLSVDPADIVKQLFGAADLDPRMAGERWLLDALLEAEPADHWPRSGAVLTRDHAVRALLAARLGLGDTTSDTLDFDADTLFAWTRSGAGPALFAALPAAERAGLSEWLEKTVGPAAPTLLALAADQRGADALPLGALASAALSAPSAEAAGFALGTLYGSALASFDALRPFADAATGVVTRWIAQAEGNSPYGTEARSRVLDVLDRADQLAADARLSPLIGADRMLPSGYRARLRALAATLDGDIAHAETALRELAEHQLSELNAESTDMARTAVRLVRWLNAPMPKAGSTAQAVREHMASVGWADLAVGILSEGDTSLDTAVGEAYHRLIGAVRERRTRLDEEFARTLADWTETASQQSTGGALLIENVLAEAAAPLARDGGRPLILVLDGMSADVAVQLAGELDRRVWTEVVPKPRPGKEAARQAAVSMLPSLTTISRASLLSGEPAQGGQSVERTGFTTFWRKRHRGAHLFHKGGYEGPPGHRLAPGLLDTLASDDVVAVVVNTIDDALADGREGARGRWGIGDVAKLTDLLNAARDYGRPVVLVSDHGHVLDRTPRGHQQTDAEGVGGARWRTGAPQPGEVALAGPRVLAGGGRITAAWREDLRYTGRQAGYHGGAALAEVTVPVITVVPTAGLIPSGWTLLPAERTTPSWWRGGGEAVPVPAESAPPAERPRGRKPAPAPQGEGIFMLPGQGTLGEQTVQSPLFKAQREFVRLAPTEKAVAAVLDALLAAGGKLSPGAVAAAAQAATGKSQRNPERFATVLERLLNIDGYPVLQLVESGRTVQLDKALLMQQFLGARQ